MTSGAIVGRATTTKCEMCAFLHTSFAFVASAVRGGVILICLGIGIVAHMNAMHASKVFLWSLIAFLITNNEMLFVTSSASSSSVLCHLYYI